MVELNSLQERQLDKVFHALSDSTRRRILDQLTREPQRVTDLAKHHSMSLNAVSKHLKVLEKAELINRKVQGRVHLCSFNGEHLKEVEMWIKLYRNFWEQRLDGLVKYVTSKTKKVRNS